ncbi:MAG TPA: DUF1553 domain-containing protein [Tepidisphaeraceae bacterium]|nr:DUF1553 domain-containing protein [Tepidisphaeraceae bacterium]
MRPALLVILCWHACGVIAAAPPDFDRDVAPVFVTHCLDCHGGPDPKGKFDLTTRARAMAGGEDGVSIIPGKPADSRLWELIDAGKMPPKKPLPPAEREIIREWIAAGAKWGSDPIDPHARTTAARAGKDWWSLRPIAQVAPPAVRDKAWARNPIDPFVLAALESRDLRPSPEVDKRLLIRRVYFGLIGLPPAPAEVDAFVADASPDAYEKVVDRLLASPQYGVRWARHWLDVARFGESNGFEFDEFRPDAWPYRDWVVESLNADLPYDEFARLQIAGDVLRPADPAALRATGFLVAGAYDTPGQTQQSQAMRKVVRQDELEDLVGTVGQTFLGLSVQCARCHDHKFDPVRQEEYFRMTAALAGVRHGVRDLPLPKEQVATARTRLSAALDALAEIERPARETIRAKRGAISVAAPTPIARWDFRDGAFDQTGHLHAHLRGRAELKPEGLVLVGRESHAIAGPLPTTLKAKTLEAWVKLANVRQRGGGVIGIQNPATSQFDTIVFGEREPGKWVAGSDFFKRTRDLDAPAETADDAPNRFVHVAVTYADDGTIAVYRDGKPYGQPYKASLIEFKANQAEIVIGMRYSPASGDRLLTGVIRQAAVYDRALSPDEIAASMTAAQARTSRDEVAAALAEPAKSRWQALREQLARDAVLASGSAGRVYAVSPKPPEKTFLLARGNPQSPGIELSAGGVASIGDTRLADFALPIDAPDDRRRIALAQWVTSPANPLFARTIVNRLWHHHFGAGLVATTSDLGFNGGRPSHPELLDYLAAELTSRKYSLKAVHRLIVTSATYRQSSRPFPAAAKAAAAVDADNRLLWHKSPVRLEAEAVRDAALAIAGDLDPTLGGPGYKEFALTLAPGTPTNLYLPLPPDAQAVNRRTLYRAWARAGRSGLLDALDCPDPSAAAPARARTTTPTQALALLNNAAMMRAAESLAKRLEREAKTIDGRITLAYRLAYGRVPSGAELDAARAAVEQHGLIVLARAILNSNEFLFVE